MTLLIACWLVVSYVASRGSSGDGGKRLAMSGGVDATVVDSTANAFALSVPKLSRK